VERRGAADFAFWGGCALLTLAFATGVVQSLRTRHRIPGIDPLDSMDDARSRARAGDVTASLVQYRVASRLSFGNVRAFEEYADALGRSGDLAGELEARMRASAEWPRSARTHTGLGLAYLRNRRLDEALASFAVALRLDPTDAAAYAGRGDALREEGRLPEAVEAYAIALHFAPREAGLHNKLGIAFALQGRRDEAAAQFEEAMRLDPTTAAAENLAKLRAAGGEVP
jgi:superkiller protein 3